MRRLETILLRLASYGPPDLVADIRRSVAGDDADVRIYRRAGVAGDLAVHIRMRSDGPDAAASELGVHLAAALRRHGMVEHSVWIEE